MSTTIISPFQLIQYFCVYGIGRKTLTVYSGYAFWKSLLTLGLIFITSLGIAQTWEEKQIDDITEFCIGKPQCELEAVFPADLDMDGDIDILVIGHLYGAAWYTNDGQGNFSEAIPIIGSFIYFPVHISAADIDNDKDLDIVIATMAVEDQIVWLENDGEGNFGVEKTIGSGTFSVQNNIEVVDVDKDGHVDVMGYESSVRYKHTEGKRHQLRPKDAKEFSFEWKHQVIGLNGGLMY